jgi:hypothetical protein
MIEAGAAPWHEAQGSLEAGNTGVLRRAFLRRSLS